MVLRGMKNMAIWKYISLFAVLVAPATALADETAAVASSSMFDYLLEGGVVVLGTLGILLILSVLCWGVIGIKWSQINRSKTSTRALLKKYESASSLADIANEAKGFVNSPLSGMMQRAMVEIEAIPPGTGDHALLASNVQRAIKRAAREGLSKLEKNISYLATVASAAPFIGLFGTVWGIMDAFAHIRPDQPILTTVAPHIAHALIATAVGLATAIPAVMAYNYFVGQIRGVAMDLDGFADDLILRLNRATPQRVERPASPAIHEVG